MTLLNLQAEPDAIPLVHVLRHGQAVHNVKLEYPHRNWPLTEVKQEATEDGAAAILQHGIHGSICGNPRLTGLMRTPTFRRAASDFRTAQFRPPPPGLNTEQDST